MGGFETKFIGYPNIYLLIFTDNGFKRQKMVRENVVSVVALLLAEVINLKPLHLYRMSSLQTKKKKRVRISVAEKVKAARLPRSGTNESVVMCQFGISRQTETNIKKGFDETFVRVHEIVVSINAKPIRIVKFTEINDAVNRFLSTARMMKFPVTQSVLTSQALLVRETFQEQEHLRSK